MLRLEECIGRGGAKAERLARARAAGLPVLDGVVLLPDEPFVDLPLAGESFIVRSSSDVEDRAAGLFLSVANVPRASLAEAISRVRASAESQSARALIDGPIAMAVLIQ